MDEKYIKLSYEMYLQDNANSATPAMTYDQFKAKLTADCSCNKKMSWLSYFLGGAALVYLLKK